MDSASNSEVFEILLVEDDPSDAHLTRRALEKARTPSLVHHAESGEDALKFLQNRKSESKSRHPDVILLDLNLPGMHGQEVLAMMRQDEVFGALPVIVLTSSDADEDVLRSFEYRANGYLVKCLNQEEFTKKLEFWISVVRQLTA